MFLSHAKLDDRYVLRLAIGNIRTERRHVERAWELLRTAARTPIAALQLSAGARRGSAVVDRAAKYAVIDSTRRCAPPRLEVR